MQVFLSETGRKTNILSVRRTVRLKSVSNITKVSPSLQNALSAGRGHIVDQYLVTSQVLARNSPLQSWIAYQRTRMSTPYPSLKKTKNKKILDAGNRNLPKAKSMFHFSCLTNMSDLSHWLALCPYGIDGGAHVNMHGRVFPRPIQSALDAHGVKYGIFGLSEAVIYGSGLTHVWLSWSDIKELQPNFCVSQLTNQPFVMPNDK